MAYYFDACLLFACLFADFAGMVLCIDARQLPDRKQNSCPV